MPFKPGKGEEKTMLDKDYLSSNEDYEEAATYFTLPQIEEATENLPDYSKYDTVAELSTKSPLPGPVVTTFGKLADQLSLFVKSDYEQLIIRKVKPDDELRRNALSRLWAEFRKNQK